jgi:phage baseplate assembly protein W
MKNTVDEVIVGRGWAFPPGLNARGIVALTNEQSEIEQAIMIILSTPVGTRVMRPRFGSRLHELVFAPMNIQTMAQARRYVEEALGMWEPRVQVTDVEVFPDSKNKDGVCLLIEIHYEVKATHDPRSLVHPFYLIPEEPKLISGGA